MKVDLKQLNDLDFENLANWPKEVKIIFAVVLAVLVGVAGYFLFIKDSMASLERLQAEEQKLRGEFEAKYRLAANLPRYREQLTQMTEQFEAMLGMLPTASEMPGLLDDVTFLATDANLQINSLNWQPEQVKEFYVELPIEMKIQGGYHEFGAFSAGVANLPRIVSLHDFTMERAANGVSMTVLAKTYRFAEMADPKGGKK
ncbi:type 4a pilus biogenesis protein PilO [Ferrimonas balearica]|uniref:type 4a pilus biogenesis protein PilO n=1 Tax=Ferrimonas balearica TaxID=44012 RepID=UPI001F17D781|nr:type 4a pilus biogenesis protein PilO [Ferrimonas balearica]MBY6018513.1 type 4a pilus biogenesis protein PilO [Halomonas denitrificans]MBY6096536.1 type 4a pilus biogenesis protein PilO [Ferrimonas balearica]